MMEKEISLLDSTNYVVSDEYNNVRVDKVLANLNNSLSRSQIQEFIDEGFVLVNNKECKASLKVYSGDVITLFEKEVEDVDIKKENIPLDIVFEDSDIIVINKPKGMVVHPSLGHYSGTLVNALLYHCVDLSGVNGKMRPGIVHRLDMDTSGLIVACKNDYAHNFLAEQLKDHSCYRKYVTIVHGQMVHDNIKIDAPIGRHPTHRQEMCVISSGKKAVTRAKVVKKYSDYSLVECILETGRTHQIRVHFKHIGFPILGDKVYTNRKPYGEIGQYLHAKELSFIHPRTKERVTFVSEYPDYFKEVLDKLESNGTLGE